MRSGEKRKLKRDKKEEIKNLKKKKKNLSSLGTLYLPYMTQLLRLRLKSDWPSVAKMAEILKWLNVKACHFENKQDRRTNMVSNLNGD